MSPALGGPGVACSAIRIRRLEAGELAGAERSRTEAHLAGCARCKATARELAEERAQLARSLPFERFAAGVAERLASAERAPPRWRSGPWVGAALAATLAVTAAVPLVRSVTAPGGPGERAKGGEAALTVFVWDRGTARALAPGEPVPADARLRVALPATPRRAHAAVVLVDADGAALLYAGPSTPGPVGDAFEWTGAGDGALVLVLADAPVDGAALAARLAARGLSAAEGGGEVLVRTLRRGAR